MKEDDFWGLVSKLYLYIRAKVLLSRNQLSTYSSTRSIGIAKYITCEQDRLIPKLPKFEWLDFENEYIDPFS